MRFKKYWIKEVKGEPTIFSKKKKGIGKVWNHREIESVKRTLAAFILQGQEACFIHHLTILCSENGIPVFKNEHDGLITGVNIPQSLIAKASSLSGLNNAKFQIKPICSPEKRDKLDNLKKLLKKIHKRK